MRIDQLAYFVKVADCGSITQAAKKLYLSQPALSASITALEKELGIQLLRRTSFGVTLTRRGAQILEDSRMILDAVSKWKPDSMNTTEALGDFQIMALPPDCTFLIKILVPRLMDEFPKLSIFIHEATTSQILSSIDKKGADIYISCYTPEEKESVEYAAQRGDVSYLHCWKTN